MKIFTQQYLAIYPTPEYIVQRNSHMASFTEVENWRQSRGVDRQSVEDVCEILCIHQMRQTGWTCSNMDKSCNINITVNENNQETEYNLQ